MKTRFRTNRKAAVMAGFASVFAFSAQVYAQNAAKSGDPQVSIPALPGGIPWGPVVAYPEANLSVLYNDNIYQQPNREKSSTITVLTPSVKLEAIDGPHVYDVSARVVSGHYSGVSTADYTDFGFTGNAQWAFSGRAGLKLTAEYVDSHDDQGAIPGGTIHRKPNEWHQSSIKAMGGYGAPGAQGRVELTLGYASKRYDNYERDAFGNPDNLKLNYDDTLVGGTFYWRVMPKTQLLFSATQNVYDYTQKSFVTPPGSPPAGFAWTNLDSTQRNYQVGVTWEAAAKTTGRFAIGHVTKDFSKSSLNDFSGTSWDASVNWRPLTYSTFDFATHSTPSESQIGNASFDKNFSVNWNHAWNSRLTTTAGYSYTKNEYEGNSGTVQTDKTDAYGVRLNYQWQRNIRMGVGYEYSDRTSTDRTYEYDRNIFSIFLNAAI